MASIRPPFLFIVTLFIVILLLSGVSERPSGQYLKDIVRPALAWRIEQLNCPEAKRLLARSIVR